MRGIEIRFDDGKEKYYSLKDPFGGGSEAEVFLCARHYRGDLKKEKVPEKIIRAEYLEYASEIKREAHISKSKRAIEHQYKINDPNNINNLSRYISIIDSPPEEIEGLDIVVSGELRIYSKFPKYKKTLAEDVLDSKASFSEGYVISLSKQLLEKTHRLHTVLGGAHLDLGMKNLMLSGNTLKLIDFSGLKIGEEYSDCAGHHLVYYMRKKHSKSSAITPAADNIVVASTIFILLCKCLKKKDFKICKNFFEAVSDACEKHYEEEIHTSVYLRVVDEAIDSFTERLGKELLKLKNPKLQKIFNIAKSLLYLSKENITHTKSKEKAPLEYDCFRKIKRLSLFKSKKGGLLMEKEQDVHERKETLFGSLCSK